MMKKLIVSVFAVLLVLTIAWGGVAMAEGKRSNTKVEELGEQARAKFKGGVKASIATQGKFEIGDTITLKATVSNLKKAPYSLQWQYKDGSKDWENVAGETSKKYRLQITEKNIAYQWRVVMTVADEVLEVG